MRRLHKWSACIRLVTRVQMLCKKKRKSSNLNSLQERERIFEILQAVFPAVVVWWRLARKVQGNNTTSMILCWKSQTRFNTCPFSVYVQRAYFLFREVAAVSKQPAKIYAADLPSTKVLFAPHERIVPKHNSFPMQIKVKSSTVNAMSTCSSTMPIKLRPPKSYSRGRGQ